MILDEIIAKKRIMLPSIIEEYHRKHKNKSNNVRLRASFYDAISKPGLSIIGEVKKASPSKGIIKKDFNPRLIATEYGNHVDALSVLTEEHFFMGSLDYLKDVHEAIDLPLLCKDFIIDLVQIDMAYELGASCVLLIAGVLSKDQLQEYIHYAQGLGLDALVEVHTEEELDKVLKTNAKIIGINNRNLSNFKIDLTTTITLSNQIPNDYLIVSESGIYNSQDIDFISSQGKIDGVLVGESFMRASDIATHAKELKNGYNYKN